jgi:hypothetical protein
VYEEGSLVEVKVNWVSFVPKRGGKLSLLFGFLALLSLSTLALSISTLVVLHILIVNVESLINLGTKSRLILDPEIC